MQLSIPNAGRNGVTDPPDGRKRPVNTGKQKSIRRESVSGKTACTASLTRLSI
jgi:hypothetical protein